MRKVLLGLVCLLPVVLVGCRRLAAPPPTFQGKIEVTGSAGTISYIIYYDPTTPTTTLNNVALPWTHTFTATQYQGTEVYAGTAQSISPITITIYSNGSPVATNTANTDSSYAHTFWIY